MIVLLSTYLKLKEKLAQAESEKLTLALQQAAMVKQWNELVTKINKKGGASFLESKPLQFTQPEIKQLVALCHPDKHGGSKSAEEMTAKLLSMRK